MYSEWNIVEPLYSGHPWDYKEVSLFQIHIIAIGTQASVYYIEGVLISEVSTVGGSTVPLEHSWITAGYIWKYFMTSTVAFHMSIYLPLPPTGLDNISGRTVETANNFGVS